jgi:hypothetical protein
MRYSSLEWEWHHLLRLKQFGETQKELIRCLSGWNSHEETVVIACNLVERYQSQNVGKEILFVFIQKLLI